MLPLSLSDGGSKRGFVHFALPLISSLQVFVDTSDLVCGLNNSKSQPTYNKQTVSEMGVVTSRDPF